MMDADYDDASEHETGEDPAEEAREQEGGRRLSSSRGWLELISYAETKFADYQRVSDRVEKLYADLERLAADGRDREFQMFWANVQVLGPSIYSRPPVPVVVTAFKDRKAVPRAAAELLERTAIAAFRGARIGDLMMSVRNGLVVGARGQAWARYDAKADEKTDKAKVQEKVCLEAVHRRDFLHDLARDWSEVDWVGKRSWLTKLEMRKRFKPVSGDAYQQAAYAVRQQQGDAEADDGKAKAGVWEIWCKSRNKVVWVAEGCDLVLDEDEPHLQLEGFFPCPRPAYGTLQPGSLIPVPDYAQYKDQLEEINELTGRISALCQAVRVRGFYPAGAGDLGDAIDTAVNSVDDGQILVPVSNWSLLGNGSPKDTIVWLPLDQVVSTIKELVGMRRQLIDDVYQITGLSDIMRGSTVASETLGAQKLKSQYGSVRIRDKQEELVRFARDLTAIVAEIAAENFAPQTLLDMSQLDLPTAAVISSQKAPIEEQIRQILQQVEAARSNPQAAAAAQAAPDQAQAMIEQARQQVEGLRGQLRKLDEVATVEKVMALLRERRLRPFILDIETDSTIQPDEDANKQRATEFVTAVGSFMQTTLPLLQQVPQAAPLAAEMLKFVASQFRAGRQLEGAIEEFADKMVEVASQPKPPDPRQAEAQAKAAADQVAQQKAMADAAKTKAEAEAKALEAQTKAADAESQRMIAEQQQIDASEAGRIEREGKIALTDRQIALMEAKRAEEAERHLQALDKGRLELELLAVNIARAREPRPAPDQSMGA
uniref:Portal protein n=1 Tax=Rhodopseudomonas palustris (strain DX-1) TaxID=652103 RepID=E6VFL9_RHOPX